ncbi:PEP-CTERM sorting domain-containing protein [Massilia sp. PAMC28688]|uniref:PEP-CTERM sorting domain-containing protein n=1 Tax=Massilia sp. PAMC28688 TaxID=2861283 RepID=UPI001C62EEBB|nr:PEP-CTERM sorting domain-containing protein [Massilia sp. PAMC28688]QYF94724.1 PEP-CTERM sorting domain-containing protein [Massilia sp. PAMC28688]
MFPTLAKFAAVTATVSSLLLSSTAVAAPWEFTTTGTISYGYDYSGVFGSADLTGQSYSLTTMIDPSSYSNGYGYQDSVVNSQYGSVNAAVTQKVTIGGVTKSYSFDLTEYTWGHSYLNDSANFNQAYQYVSGTTTGAETLTAYSSVYSYANNFLTTLDFAQNMSYTAATTDYGYAYFNLIGNRGQTYFQATPSTVSINAADVPEPAPLALFGLGLVALAYARRKSA